MPTSGCHNRAPLAAPGRRLARRYTVSRTQRAQHDASVPRYGVIVVRRGPMCTQTGDSYVGCETTSVTLAMTRRWWDSDARRAHTIKATPRPP